MTAQRGKSLVRMWALVDALRTTRRGLTVGQLIERTGGSRASIYRDLEVLRSVGVPIDKVPISGEMRYLLAHSGGTQQTLNPLQFAALLSSRNALRSLEGTRLVRELDALIKSAQGTPRMSLHVHVPLSNALAPDRISDIDRALDQGKCLRIRYRSGRDVAPSYRNVEPVELRVSADQPYLVAYEPVSQKFKIYKLARMTQVQILPERAHAQEHYQPDKVFAHTRGIWAGEARDVAVRLREPVARFAPEWPLHKQQSVEDLSNGDVIVRARVAGLFEPMHWVLSWGQNAEVLEPRELRRMVIEELSGALEIYGSTEPPRAERTLLVSDLEVSTA